MSLENITETVQEQIKTLQDLKERIEKVEVPKEHVLAFDEMLSMLIELQVIDHQNIDLLLDFNQLFTEILEICHKHKLTQENTITDAIKFKLEIVSKLEAFYTR